MKKIWGPQEGEKFIDWAIVFDRVCVGHVWAALLVLCAAAWVGAFKLAFYFRDLLQGLLCR